MHSCIAFIPYISHSEHDKFIFPVINSMCTLNCFNFLVNLGSLYLHSDFLYCFQLSLTINLCKCQRYKYGFLLLLLLLLNVHIVN